MKAVLGFVTDDETLDDRCGEMGWTVWFQSNGDA